MIPSILSRIPPCPGNNEPVSFTFAFLFNNEMNKSPACDIVEINKEINIKLKSKLN